jgi:chaperone required for assembly of F1-ATPase
MTDRPANGGGTARGPSREAFVAPRPRRFYKAVAVAPDGESFVLALDGRPVRTPGKNVLSLPTRALADAIAAEWEAQREEILADTMPLTRLANTVIDGVMGKEAAVRADIVAFAGSDLVCYRAGSPEGLVAAQSQAWDPVLAWTRDELGADFLTAEGIMHVTQPEASLARIAQELAGLHAWQITPLHQITTLTGSALIALAHLKGAIALDVGWRAAHVDEDWQILQWGEDAEARMRRDQRWRDIEAASRLLDLIQPSAS